MDGSSIEKDSKIMCLTWHPTKKILACGLDNGELSIWNEHDKELHNSALSGNSKISKVLWNGDGSRLIIGEEVTAQCFLCNLPLNCH